VLGAFLEVLLAQPLQITYLMPTSSDYCTGRKKANVKGWFSTWFKIYTRGREIEYTQTWKYDSHSKYGIYTSAGILLVQVFRY
jgi:hypothetical protein